VTQKVPQNPEFFAPGFVRFYFQKKSFCYIIKENERKKYELFVNGGGATMCEKYMVLCVAGQSNAVGYDESKIPPDYLGRFRTDRIRQLGLYGEDNLKVIPLGACAQSYQDMRPYGHPENPPQTLGTRGIQLPLADALLDLIPADYGVLVLSCAYGGSGFTVGDPGLYDEENLRPEPGVWRWGVTSPYYRGMKDRVAYALDLNPANRFLGVVWIQGEHDSGNSSGQISGFCAMTDDFFQHFQSKYPGRVYRGSWDRGIWYNVETVSYWYTVGQCQQIWDHYRRWNPNTYVDIPRETHSNEFNGTGITASIRAAHFGDNAFAQVIAPRVAQVISRRLRD
jgi:putative transposase